MKKIKRLSAVVLILFLITLGLYWLVIGLSLGYILYRLYISETSLFLRIRKNSASHTLVLVTFILAISIFIRLFFFEIFSIPSSSMENTLFKGDKVLVSKLHYGPKLPGSPFEIPLINILWYLQAQANTNVDSIWWNYKRLSGFSTVKHNDIFVFRHPLADKKNNFFIKRCTGLPGDTFQIINSVVFVNRNALSIPELVRQKCRLKIKDWQEFQKQTDSLKIENAGINSKHSLQYTELILTEIQRKQISNFESIDSIHILISPDDSLQWVYPKQRSFRWTIDNYGPVVIPSKGFTISLDNRNFQLYRRTIELLEKTKIKEVKGSYYLNDKKISTYTFRSNYYFMMGDKRWDSNDSRYWGFVPEENIIGKGTIVLFSYNNEEGFNWTRLLHLIH